MGEALDHITIAWAQLEKRTLIERTRAGMERARTEGKVRSDRRHDTHWIRIRAGLMSATWSSPGR
jgi:DNA invertase Pin-like site-specific DNA recombinase